MKYFFSNEEREKCASKIIKLTDDIKWESIMNTFEEVDINGEEKVDVDNEEEIKNEINEISAI